MASQGLTRCFGRRNGDTSLETYEKKQAVESRESIGD
jgi:hypothetical protein